MTAMWPFQCCCFCILLLLNAVYALECDPTKIKGEMTQQLKYECLVQTLFDPSKYSPLVRPVANISEPLNVDFSIQLSQIITLDEKNQVMKTNVWLQLYWVDYQLRWSDSQVYQEIGVVRIRPELVWRPDVVLFNNADGNYEVSYMSNCLVYQDGYINWIPPAIYKSSCKIDVQYFPFDEQLCDMKFGSWTFLDDQLNFSFYKGVSHFDVSDYLENGAWDIVEGDAEITKTSTGRTNEYKAMVIFRLRLRRKTLFYTVNLIIPCVLISFVTLSVFILPADAGEKITLCISILLALVVFLLLISKILPPSLTIPLISQYLLFTFIMNILAIVSTVIVINRNYRTPRTHQMPYWIRLVFLNFLPRVMFMKRPDHDQRWNDTSDDKEDTQPKRHVNRDPDLTRITTQNCVSQGQNIELSQGLGAGQIENLIETHHANCRLNATSQGDDDPTPTTETSFMNRSLIPVSREIYNAAESVKFIHRHLKKDDEYHTVIDDWRYVARVIDRLLLTIFFVVTVFGSLGIFMKAPHILQTVNQNEILSEMNAAWDAVKSS
ncbi:acetylcholine receptor subunit beta-like 1 [Mercenaria mercenaria]|uniref:acetylcholine receptor subunit beta-like 1 n=1 Tax=Mercenaria mercenaria TaxID=6596 RepID=UPI00234F8932|nr:acetylcholine receptor subunit beta-like 1 [Mercenaria mercenaria]